MSHGGSHNTDKHRLHAIVIGQHQERTAVCACGHRDRGLLTPELAVAAWQTHHDEVAGLLWQHGRMLP